MDYLFGSSGDSETSNRKLQVRIGPNVSSLKLANPNDEKNPHFIDSPYFVGNIVIRIRDFRGVTPNGSEPLQATEYFGSRKRLFAVQVCGRFKHEYTAEDLVFGAEFEQKVNPPTGAWVALKFANLIDPALQADVYSDTPWLFSPILSAMNVVSVTKSPIAVKGAAPFEIKSDKASKSSEPDINGPDPSFKHESSMDTSVPLDQAIGRDPSPTDLLGEWTWYGTNELTENNVLLNPDDDEIAFESDAIAERRKHFQKPKARKATIFKPENVYNFEIFAPFIDFNTFDLTLGINVNLVKYLNKQPIRLMAKSASKNIQLFVIEFALVKDHESEASESSEAGEEVDSQVEVPPIEDAQS